MLYVGYGGEDRMTDGTYGYNNLNATHHLAPDKILLGTEACSCPGVRINDWLRAERVGHDVMFDLANFAHGWIDWNLLVDSQGGPNHLKNFCDAAIITKSDYSGIHIQPKFYYLGHFSRFVKPGYVRIASQTTGNFGYVATDANIQPGVEVGIFPCEASARQIWRFNPLYQTIELLNRANSTWLSKSKEVVMCIAHGDSNRNYFRLVDCNDNHQHLLKVQFQRDAKRVVDLDSGLCLSLAAQIFQPGALAELTPCTNPVANYQRFDYLANTGEIVSEANGFCLTAGWPYLNSIAFSGPTDESVAVVMNEAPVGTTLAIHDAKQDSSLGLWIPAHSIATLVY